MKKLKMVMAGIVGLMSQMNGDEDYKEVREEFMNKIAIMHAAGLYLARVGAPDDMFPFGHPDLDKSDIREADGTRYVRVVDKEEGSLLAVYREVGESELEYAENCPTRVFA
jgi:hypothetical protein